VRDIIKKAVEVLKAHLSEDEIIELSEELDSSIEDSLLEAIDEYLFQIRPDLFASPYDGKVERAE